MQKIKIIGNLGKKPEERHTAQGRKVISFSVAARVSKEKSQWYDVAIWEDKIPVFEKILRYLDKGSRICIVGDLGMAEPYQRNDGNMGVRLRISPDSMNFVGSSEKSHSPSVREQGIQYGQRKEQMHFGPGPNDYQEEIPF